MPNKLRLLTRNLVALTGIGADSTDGAHSTANLLTRDKTQVWRATGTSATLFGAAGEELRASTLHLPHCNGSPALTGRLFLYSSATYSGQLLDTGIRQMCPEPGAEVDGWAAADLANAYEQGGGAWGRLWFPETAFKSWRLILNDPGNLQGQLEAADVYLGPAWSPTYDLEPGGAGVVQRDSSTQFRTAAGSLKVQPGTVHDEMTLDLTMMHEADRKAARRMLRSLRRRTLFIATLWPDDADPERERAHSIYGVLTADAEMALDGPDNFGTKLQIAQI